MRQREYHKTFYKVHLTTGMLIICMAAVYVWQINYQTQNAFAIRELEDRKIELLDSIHDKELAFSSARSLATIAQRAIDLDLENPSDVTYLKIGLSAVAVDYEQQE